MFPEVCFSLVYCVVFRDLDCGGGVYPYVYIYDVGAISRFLVVWFLGFDSCQACVWRGCCL